MLRRCGFGEKLVSWLAPCISSVHFSVSVNGSLSDFCNSYRGLKQGDPLSPLLFVVVMEASSKMFTATVDRGLFSSFSMASLTFFEAISGLKINLAKSVLVPMGNVDNVVKLANILGCGTSFLPLKYLGMPLGASYKAKSIWDSIVEKIERRLVS